MTANGLRDKVAVIGVGSTSFHDLYRDRDTHRTAEELGIQALKSAIDDAGIDKEEIDGMINVRVSSYQQMANAVDLPNLRIVNSLQASGRMSGVALQYAAMAIATGQASTIAIVYGNNGRSAAAKYGGGFDPDAPEAFEAMHGMTSPGAHVSMMFRRHQHEFGTSVDALARLAMNNRKNAALNPNAVFRSEITYEEYMSSRFIAEPLRLYDYCIINDGGVAVIVTAADRAKDMKQPPVYVGATYACSHLTSAYANQDFFYSASQDVAKRVYAEAGVDQSDIDCLQIYDNFTPTILFSLEGFGFTKQGESGPWVEDGNVGYGSNLPLNTSGAHTGESYMQGMNLLAESVRQVRGQAGPRQVDDCEVVQYICVSPIVTSHILHS